LRRDSNVLLRPSPQRQHQHSDTQESANKAAQRLSLVRVRSETAAQTEHKVQRRLLLDVVVAERAAVLELLARKDQALLVRRNALLVLCSEAANNNNNNKKK
jgi:hypothetical protein